MLSPLPTTVLNANTKLRMKLIKPCTDILTTQKLSINCNFFHQLIFSYFIFFLFHVYVAKRSTTEREKLRTALSFLKIKIFLKIFVLSQNNISHLMSISALPHLDKFDRPVSLPPVRAIPETFMSGNDRSWLQKIYLGKITQLHSPPLSMYCLSRHSSIYLLVAAKMISGTSLSTTTLGSTSTWPLRGAATPVIPAT